MRSTPVLDVRPIFGALGAEIHGSDHGSPTGEVFTELEQLVIDGHPEIDLLESGPGVGVCVR